MATPFGPQAVRDTILALTDRRDRDCLLLRLGLEEGGDGEARTLEAVAALMNTSREMARAIERRALRRLKAGAARGAGDQ